MARMVQSDGYFCAGCGYDLSGLRVAGQCPECGKAFDKVKGEGVAGGGANAGEKYRRGDRLAARLRTIFLGLAALLVMACGGLLSLGLENWPSVLAVAGLVALVLLMGAVTSYLYEDEA